MALGFVFFRVQGSWCLECLGFGFFRFDVLLRFGGFLGLGFLGYLFFRV